MHTTFPLDGRGGGGSAYSTGSDGASVARRPVMETTLDSKGHVGREDLGEKKR